MSNPIDRDQFQELTQKNAELTQENGQLRHRVKELTVGINNMHLEANRYEQRIATLQILLSRYRQIKNENESRGEIDKLKAGLEASVEACIAKDQDRIKKF